MARRNSPNIRVCTKFAEDMKKLRQERVSKGLMKIEEAKWTKITELLTRTQGYQQSLKELESKPERKRK